MSRASFLHRALCSLSRGLRPHSLCRGLTPGLVGTLAAVLALASGLVAERARADEPSGDPANQIESLRALSGPPPAELRFIGSVEAGRGLRFNNPYRLATELGARAESVSATAGYLDIGAAVAFGAPAGLQHGGALHLSVALAGVPQQVLTPTYFVAYRGAHRYLAYGRLGPSIILTPDPTIGGELAVGFGWFLTAHIALAGEVVADVYYGAGTPDVGIVTYPLLSGQLGLLFDYEVLP